MFVIVSYYFILPKYPDRFDEFWNKIINFRNVRFLDDVIQLRHVAVYKYTSMNIYVFSFCSLVWNMFILLNIYEGKKQSLSKSSRNMTLFISQNNSKVSCWASAEMIQFMERATKSKLIG